MGIGLVYLEAHSKQTYASLNSKTCGQLYTAKAGGLSNYFNKKKQKKNIKQIDKKHINKIEKTKTYGKSIDKKKRIIFFNSLNKFEIKF